MAKGNIRTEVVLELSEPTGFIFPVTAFGAIMSAETALSSAIRGSSQPFIKVYETLDRRGAYTEYNAVWIKGYKVVFKPVPTDIQKLHDEAKVLTAKGADKSEEEVNQLSDIKEDLEAYYER